MTTEEEQVEAAAMRFYDAIEQMVCGKGLAAMAGVWHHTDRVTSGHPSGDWANGYEEVMACFDVFAAFGRADRGGTKVLDMKPHVYGDVAYVTVVFQASPTFSAAVITCTDILHKMNGEWKIIHHHADKSPAMAAALEKLLAEGG